VITTEGRHDKIYESAGDQAFNMTELVAAVSDWASKVLPYQDLPPAAYRERLVQAGLSDGIVDLSLKCRILF
jgi:NAD(P)H dehydrogenase (quinone)